MQKGKYRHKKKTGKNGEKSMAKIEKSIEISLNCILSDYFGNNNRI